MWAQNKIIQDTYLTRLSSYSFFKGQVIDIIY